MWFLFSFLLLVDSSKASAPARVVEVRPSFDGETIVRDIYFNQGKASGLKIGQELIVLRRDAVRDGNSMKRLDFQDLPVAKIKILFLGENHAIGRVVELSSAEKGPHVDLRAVLVGDHVVAAKGFSGFVAERKTASTIPSKSTKPSRIEGVGKSEVEPANLAVQILDRPQAVDEAALEARRAKLAKELNQIKETKVDDEMVLSTDLMSAPPLVIQ